MQPPAVIEATTVRVLRPPVSPGQPETIVVGIGDIGVTDRGILATHALGSCIAVCLWDAEHHVAGLLHFMLPSSGGRIRTGERPEMYADSGIPLLVQRMQHAGARSYRARIIGGSSIAGTSVFAVGQRNITAARRQLWSKRITLEAEDVGGSIPRTVRMRASDGRLLVRGPGRQDMVL